MKKHITLTFMGLAIFLSSCGKKESTTPASTTGTETQSGTYVLASTDLLPPPGKTLTVTSDIEMKDAEMTLIMGENQMVGEMNHTTQKVETAEPLSDDKLRHLIVREINEGKVVMNGQEQSSPEKTNPLVGIPVIVTETGGKITATLENGTPSSEQETALKKIVEEYEQNDSLIMYGDTPRKPGDRWDADPSKLSNFAGATDMSGTFSTEFIRVEEIGGINCAILKCDFDLSGKTVTDQGEPQADMTIKGKADVIRSIDDLVDLDVKINGTISMEGEPSPAMKMKVEGSMTMHQTTELE